MPHAVPLHVAVPLDGVGHGVHDEPQVATAELETQVPLHRCWPAGQRHWPPLQVCGAAHLVSHSPQFALSLWVSTQAPLQSLAEPWHDVPHRVPSQVAAPPVGAGHSVHEVPHELVEALETQAPPQS